MSRYKNKNEKIEVISGINNLHKSKNRKNYVG